MKRSNPHLTLRQAIAGLGCLGLLASAGRPQAFAATNSTTVGSITWDFNSTRSFGGNGTSAWTNNADVAKFDKSGTSYVSVNSSAGEVGCAGMIFGNVAGNWIFTNQLLRIGAGGIAQTLASGSTGLVLSNNVQMTAAQTWSINAARPIKMMGSLSGSGPLTLDALGFLGNYTFAGANSFTGATVLSNGAMLTLDYFTMGQNNAKLDPLSNLYLSPGLVVLSGATGSYAETVAATFLSGGGSSVRRSGSGTETLALGPLARSAYATYFQGADSIASTTTTNDATGILGCWAVCNTGWASTNALGAIVANSGTSSWNAGNWNNASLNANANQASGVTNITGPMLLNSLRLGGTTFLDLSNNVLTLAGGGLMSVNSNPTLTNGFVQSALPSGELFIATVNNANLTNYASIQDNATTGVPTALVKLGDQALVLAGNNKYSGGTYVNGGSLQVVPGGSLGGGTLFVGNYLTASPGSAAASVLFNNPGTVNATNSLAGSGIIGNIGSGTVNLAISNSSSTLTVTNGNGSATLRLIAQGNNTLAALKNGSGTLVLDGDADGAARLTSISTVISCGSGGSLMVNGGNWSQPYADFLPGAGSSLTVNGGAFTVSGGNGFNGSSVTVNGGTFQTLNNSSRFSFNTDGQTLTINGGSMLVSNTIGLRLGNQNGTASGTGNSANVTAVQTNGTLFVVGQGSVGLDLGGAANNGKTVSYAFSGGTIRIGGGGWLNIGADTNGNTASSFTMTGGKLLVSGPIQGGQSTNVAKQVFAFNGGTVAAYSINAAYLRDALANAPGTLANAGGTLAPGDVGTAGKTTILGNYSCSPSAVLAIDIGGTNPATAFTNAAGYYDFVAVTTNALLNGSLNVSFINGYLPLPTDTFTILMSTNQAITNITGAVSGSFANLDSNGRISVSGIEGASFHVTITSTSVVLDNYQGPVAAQAPVANFTASAATGVRPLQVTFTDVSTGTITNLLWQFGDTSSTNVSIAGGSVTHTYLAEGNYTVTLTASGPGGVGTTNQVVVVTVPTAPRISSIKAGGSGLTLQGTNGPVSAAQTYYYVVLSSTNLAAGLAGFTPVATNAFNPDGSFSNSIPVSAGEPKRFYLMQMP